VKTSLKARGGGELPVPEGFAALRDGTVTSHPLLEAMRPRFGEVLAALAQQGVPADQLVVAWDFTVGSDEFVRRLPTTARDKALAELDRAPSEVTILSDRREGDGTQILRRIDGTLTAPLFLTNDGAYAVGTTLALGADGLPELKGRYEIPFTAVIPRCAYDGRAPVGIMMYGHGLNGSGEQAASGAIRATAAAVCVISVGTDMRGMNEPNIGNIARALTDLNHADEVMEVLVQGLTDHVTLARAMETVLPNQVFVCRAEDHDVTGCTTGRSLADPSKLYYYGLSQGHIFGTAVMAYVPNIRRGVLGVGGGGYAMMLERSQDWPTYRTIMQGAYSDPLDVVMAINLFQQRWDQTETSGIVNVVLDGTATGTPRKQLLLHMAVGDAEVPNLATEWQARSMGIPVIMPASVRVPWGMQTQEAPVAGGSGLVIMDGGADPVPLTNEPAPPNEMHSLTRNQAASKRQIGVFFATGEIRNECAGACYCADGKCD
jgi:hypothetical protein